MLLGLDPGIDAFATQAEIAEVTGVTRGRVPQQLGALHDAWGGDEDCRELLDTLAETAWQSLADSGGVAAVGELAQSVLAVMPPAADGDGSPAIGRVVAGLLRIALDRVQALLRADDDAREFFSRRRDGRIVLLTADQALLDPAEALGRAADELVNQAAAAGEHTVPAARAAGRLLDVWTHAVRGLESPPPAPDTGRLLRLAAALARDAALAGSGDLYMRGMPATAALTIALAGVGAQPVGVQEVHARVRAKFPALAPLPDRPRLDQLIDATGLDLVYDEAERAYRARAHASGTLGLDSRPATVLGPVNRQILSDGPSGHRLTESTATRSFLAIGVDAVRADRAVDALTGRFGAKVVDVTQVLIDAMKAQAAEFGLDWGFVQEADAAPAGTRDAEGLATLVKRSLPAVEAAITAAASRGAGRHPARTADRRRAARPVRPPEHPGAMGRPGDPPPAGRLGARPATRRDARRRHRPAAPAAGRTRPVHETRPRLDRRLRACPGTRRRTMTATEALTEDLKKQVIALEDDLRRRVDEDPGLREEWQRVHRQATDKERTAWSWAQWRDDRVTQTAVAWVLMSVFIRFCEDNGLVKPVWITGPRRRRQEALDAELAFFREHGTWTEREWLEDAVAYLGKLPATKALVDTHSALRYASPSGDARRGTDQVLA